MMDRRFLVVLLGGLLLISTSCSDPTGVGSELVGSGGQGTPEVYEVLPDTFGTDTSPALTGLSLSLSNIQNNNRSWRFLAGTVKDPISGTIETEGYVDFLGTEPRSGTLTIDPADSLDAELRLQPTYFHGDTLSTYEVNLFEVRDEADMGRAPADTSFDVQRQLGTTFSVTGRQLTDSLVTLPLPESWIRDHIDAIQSDTFGTDVNGFKIAAANEPSAADRQVVVGFDLNSTTLRVAATEDTVDFQALKSFTHIERRGAPENPLEDRVLLQDGAGQGLFVEWDYDRPVFTDTLKDTPLNTAEITVPIDSTTMRSSIAGEPSFVRPDVNGYRVFATRADDTPTCNSLGLPQRADDSDTCILFTNTTAAPGAALVTSEISFTIFERALFETPLFTRFRFEIANRTSANASAQSTIQRGLPSTLPVLVRTDPSLAKENLPRATLVVTPL